MNLTIIAMIKEFQLTPYPRKLFVIKDEDFDQIKDQFEIDEDEEIDDKFVTSYAASTILASKDGDAGYIVYITRTTEDSHLVHESVHVAIYLYEDICAEIKKGMDQEPFAYLVEHIYTLLKQVYDE